MKFSKFTNILKKDSYLMHNTLMNTVLKLNSNDIKEYIDNIEQKDSFNIDENNQFQKTLKSLNMIVNEEEDELATLNSMYYSFEHNSELSVMLIVTRKCNFRCAYCYEEYSNDDMSQDVFDNVTEMILEQIKNNKYKRVFLSFFGGEPTLMANEINKFMNNLLLKNNNLEDPAIIQAVITTNGYLLTQNVIDEFISNNIIRYQITVDGMEDEHNSSRYLAGGQGSWKTIIENLKYFKEIDNDDVSVLIRSNITPMIYDNIDEWLEFLNENFNDPKRFRMHFETAKDFGKMNDYNFNLCNNGTDIILDIIERSKKYNLPLELLGFRTTPFSLICYAARQCHYIIDFDGVVKKCTSSSLDEPYNIVGLLQETGLELDLKKAAQWTSYELSDKCKSCKILPICYGRKCPVSRDYYENCNYLIESYIKGLEYCYLNE